MECTNINKKYNRFFEITLTMHVIFKHSFDVRLMAITRINLMFELKHMQQESMKIQISGDM